MVFEIDAKMWGDILSDGGFADFVLVLVLIDLSRVDSMIDFLYFRFTSCEGA